MKKSFIRLMTIIALLAIVSVGASAQIGALSQQQRQEQPSYALIDMQYLMDKIPHYKSATEKIQKETDKWTKEIAALNEKAKQLYIKYQQDLDTMSADERLKRENAIVKVEEEATQLQQKYFGRTGELAKLQEKMIKPIQDAIYEAVKVISQSRGYLIVFDRASSMGSIVYADPAADISNDVLVVLGISE